MLHKKGLLIAVKVVSVFMLMAFALSPPASAQSNLAARVSIEGSDGVLGDVLLVKDNDDVIIYGLAGSVPALGTVTITAGNLDPITANASYTGKFPIQASNPIRIVDAASVGTATIDVEKNDGSGTVSGTIALDITADSVLQAIKDYQDEAEKVIAGEKTSIEKGVPPHRLLSVTATNAADQPSVGKVLLSQRLVGQGAGSVIVDEIEGISDAGITPELQSVPAFSKIGVYGVSIADVNNPDTMKRLHLVETASFFDGSFISNGSFFPFIIENINSGNEDEIEARNASTDEIIVVPQPTDTIYLRILVDDGSGTVFTASISNDISAAVEGDVTVTNNNTSGVAGAPGANGLAILQGTADPYALVSAYAADDSTSEILAQTSAGADGSFTMTIPPTAEFDDAKGEYGRYTPRQVVYLGVLDLLGNESISLTAVQNIDTESVVFETPATTVQADGSVVMVGRIEPLAQVLVTGHTLTGTQIFFAGGGKADADGNFSIVADSYYEYNVEVVDQAGNITNVTIPGDQVSGNPVVTSITAVYPQVQIQGTVEPNAGVIPFGIAIADAPADPQTVDALPDGADAFEEIIALADASGNFSLILPAAVGQLIYLRGVDPAGNGSQYVPVPLVDSDGNPLVTSLVTFDSIVGTNSIPGVPDALSGRTIDANTGVALENLVVGAYTGMTSETDVDIPFVDLLSDLVDVDSNGLFTLTVPDRSPLTDEFITDFYLVAFVRNADFSLSDVGFIQIDEDNGFDRVGPDILFPPLSSDVMLYERGAGSDDMMNIGRIYPAGTGAGSSELPADALPYVVIIADGNDDDEIDVTSPTIQVLGIYPLNAIAYGTGTFPMPGVNGINLGDNHWDAAAQTWVGNAQIFVALIDASGNLSPDPDPVNLDVVVADPDASLVTALGTAIFGDEGTVEADSTVVVYENADKTGWIGTVTAYDNGGFAITGLSLTQDEVYIVSIDTAGNESNAVKVEVTDPDRGAQFLVLDGFGVLHTPTSTISSGLLQNGMARSLSSADSSVYMLQSDGTISLLSGNGVLPSEDELVSVSNDYARDLEVVSANPFAAYILLGNGVILTYGDVPFFGDISQPDIDITPTPMNDGTDRFFIDQNGNGVWDTEDENGNGVLDWSVGLEGVFITEDTGIDGMEGSEGNTILDEEKIVTPGVADQGFGWDIARDLELVRDADGTVKGYVILDGYGVLWAFGSDIGAENIRPNSTNGIATSDLFRSLELIVESGKIVDFISMNGLGQLFALPSDQGGVLGAGPTSSNDDPDGDYAGFLSADQYGITIYVFDIARDIAPNSVDANDDGTVDWQDGFYILNGYGGIQAIGGAPELDDAPFLGMDIARDLEF